MGAGHQQIFDTIYAGSTIRYTVIAAREIDDRVILARVRATLDAPSGPLAGESNSIATLVVVRSERNYEIAAFHNTLVASGG